MRMLICLSASRLCFQAIAVKHGTKQLNKLELLIVFFVGVVPFRALGW